MSTVLLHTQLQPGKGYDRRLFHQLFRQPRLATHASRRDVLEEDLGHVDNLLGNRTRCIEETEDVHQLFSHQRHRDVKNRQRKRGVDDLVHWVLLNPLLLPRGGQAANPRQAHLRRQEKSTQCLPRGEWDAPERGRVLQLVLLPRPCPSSDLVRYGACTRTGPLRRSSVHTSNMHGGVALFAALRHWRVQLLQPPT